MPNMQAMPNVLHLPVDNAHPQHVVEVEARLNLWILLPLGH